MTKTTIISTKLDNLIELSNEAEFLEDSWEEMSSVVPNSETVSWTKFVLTDDRPNENKKRVPQEEFSNLIKTGVYMPFKMAFGEIKNGHEESYPLGVIAQLRQSGNQIVALAALWRREREEDISYLKSCIAEKTPVNVSWEILHEDTRLEEDGVEALIGTSLRGVTIVGRPAYAGRTPVLQVASKQDNSDSEENKLDELEKLQLRVSELESNLASKVSELEAKDTKLSELESELATLREFKAAIDKQETDNAKVASIREIFSKANITKPEEYFVENKEKFLAMETSEIEFFVQELVAFASTNTNKQVENSSSVPVIVGDAPKKLDIKELASELRKNSK